jgi:hypothetical protein
LIVVATPAVILDALPAPRPQTILGAAVAGKGDAGRVWRGQVGEWILRLIVVADLEMQVGAASASAGADRRDLLAARDARALANQVALVMSVNRDVTAAMLDDDDVAVTVEDAGVNYIAVIGGIDRRADRSRDIDAVMHCAVANPKGRGYYARDHGPFELAIGARHRPWIAQTEGRRGRRKRSVVVLTVGNYDHLADAEITRIGKAVGGDKAIGADAVRSCESIDGIAGSDDVAGGSRGVMGEQLGELARIRVRRRRRTGTACADYRKQQSDSYA